MIEPSRLIRSLPVFNGASITGNFPAQVIVMPVKDYGHGVSMRPYS
jgi:hypothetical protein